MDSIVSAILFDADGVLLDTCELHYAALNEALKPYGFCIEREEHLREYNGLPTRVKLNLLTLRKGLDPELHEEILDLKQKLTLKGISEVIPLDPEKAFMMRSLREAGFKTAVCSNATVESVSAMLGAIGVLPFVDAYFGNNQGFAPKPAPDLYLAAASALGVPIRRCAIVEDSPVGIAAAKATGCYTIFQVGSAVDVNLRLFTSYLTRSSLQRCA